MLQQFSQEKLTRWLREIEYAMQEHTKLRPTLEEKKGQLESHQSVHRDITSRNSLVHSVCSKAESIMASAPASSSSLKDYVTSIRKLFKNIEVKSQDLTDKLNLCIVDHSNYNDLLDTFRSFSAAQMDLVSKCVDLHGEKASLVDKLEIVGQLKASALLLFSPEGLWVSSLLALHRPASSSQCMQRTSICKCFVTSYVYNY